MDSVFESAYSLGQDLSIEPDDIPKTNSTVWILGKKYNSIQELDLIRRDVQSRLWCTYRRGFVPIGTPQLTTDRGWGCTLRCGQMVLAQALINLHLGRDWFWTPETRDPTYLKIVNRFEDNRKSPFSIHQIALMGDSEDKKVGQWFGPNTVAQVMKKLIKYDDWCSLVIHVALDNLLATEEIYELCIDKDDTWKPLLLIVPLRLGLNEINSVYFSGLKKCFEIPGTVGMIGGRPNQALYFIGYVGDEALFLDPHTTQKTGSVGAKETETEIELDETFHHKYAARINFLSMDPSTAVCFLCRTKDEFTELCSRIVTDLISTEKQPLFEIVSNRPTPWTPSTSQSQQTKKRQSTTTAEQDLISIESTTQEDFEELDTITKDESDEDFEIIA